MSDYLVLNKTQLLEDAAEIIRGFFGVNPFGRFHRILADYVVVGIWAEQVQRYHGKEIGRGWVMSDEEVAGDLNALLSQGVSRSPARWRACAAVREALASVRARLRELVGDGAEGRFEALGASLAPGGLTTSALGSVLALPAEEPSPQDPTEFDRGAEGET